MTGSVCMYVCMYTYVQYILYVHTYVFYVCISMYICMEHNIYLIVTYILVPGNVTKCS